MNRRNIMMAMCFAGMGGGCSWALAQSAVTTQVTPWDDGLIITVRTDLAQVKYEATQGRITLPGVGQDGIVPMAALPVVLPPQVRIVEWIVTPVVEGLNDTTQWPLLPLTFPSTKCEEEAKKRPPPAWLPEAWATLDGHDYHHGIHKALIHVWPIRLETAPGRWWGARELQIRLRWAPVTTPEAVVRPKATHPALIRFKAELQQHAVNGGDVERFSPSAAYSTAPPTYVPSTPTGTVEGVLLCPQSLIKYYRPFVDDKIRAGHAWDLVTYEWVYAQPAYQQGNFTDEPARIRAFLQEAYQQYSLQYVTFGGTPPYVPAKIGRDIVNGLGSSGAFPHRSFGYFTNLDGGDHTELTSCVERRITYVTLQDPATAGDPMALRQLTLIVEERTPHPERCGYTVMPATRGGSGRSILTPFQLTESYNAMFDSVRTGVQTAEAFAAAHPELWGQEFVYAEIVKQTPLTTCDPSSELTASWLPPDPALGGVSLALHRTKLRRYQEPNNPVWAARLLSWNANILGQPEDQLAWGMQVPVMSAPWNTDFAQAYREGVNFGYLGSFGCREFSIELAHQVLSQGIQILNPPGLQPSGFLTQYGNECTFGESYGSPIVGFQGLLWAFAYMPSFLHPDAGPVAIGYGHGFLGLHSTEPDLLGLRDFAPGYLPLRQARASFARIEQLQELGGGFQGHHRIFVGDPLVRPWYAVPERAVVTHPADAQETVTVIVKDLQNQPLVGVGVVLSKRKPDGTYAYYQRQMSDAQGLATFAVGPLAALGSGVVNVEITDWPVIPFRDFYPYHGTMALPGNRPPVIVATFPDSVPSGTWMVLDASDSFDLDGDPVTITWRWNDVRGGTLQAFQETGGAVRVFLPSGENLVTVTVSDGQSVTQRDLTINVSETALTGLFVTHPAQTALAFTVTVEDWNHQPMAGAQVRVTKRQSNGSFPLGLTLTTDEDGQAIVALPVDPWSLGMGVLAVRVSKSGYTPYFGGMILPAGNRAPVLDLSQLSPVDPYWGRPFIENRFPASYSFSGQWIGTVYATQPMAFDPDGDELAVQWRWQDWNGKSLASFVWQAYMTLPDGPSTITLSVTDGAAPLVHPLTLTGVPGLDWTAPLLWPTQVAIPPEWGWVTLPVTVVESQTALPSPAWTLVFGARDPKHYSWAHGPIPPGIAGWTLMDVTEIGAALEGPVTCTLLNGAVRVLAGRREDGTPREYAVKLKVWDHSGNVKEGVLGKIVMGSDHWPPELTARAPLTLPLSQTWVPVPLSVVSPGSPTLAGALEWEGVDPAPAGLLPPPLIPEVMGVASNDPAQPALSYRLEGTTLWVRADQNGDATLRTYAVTLRVRDAAGHASPAKVNTIWIVPAGSQVLQGFVQGYLEDPIPPGQGGFEFGPASEPGVWVEWRTVNGTHIQRALTNQYGHFTLYVPLRAAVWRLSKGGCVFGYRYWNVVSGAMVTSQSSLGVTLGGSQIMGMNHHDLEGWVITPRPNQHPVAAVAGTLTVQSSNPTAPVTLDGRASSDPDQDLLTYTWTWTDLVGHPYRQVGPLVTAEFPRGTTPVTLTVSDGTASASTICQVRVQAAPRPSGGE